MDATDADEQVHDNSWSADFEGPRYADDRDRTVADAIEAVERTTAGNHVNLVTHGECGHPEAFLFEPIRERFPDADVEFVDRCGCGGYVTRVHV